MLRLANYINGESAPPAGGEYVDVFDPATGKKHAEAPASDARDVDAAVRAAQGAFASWERTPAAERSQAMLRIADLLERDLEQFAQAESADTGKPISLAHRVDIPRAIANFRFFATAILHTESAAHDSDGDAINYTLRKPRGVAGLISPWNLPLYLLSWKIAPAIATGNTCVAKPSEVTPLTAAMLGPILTEVGIPPGVINIVHGFGDAAGKHIVEHPDAPTISFTGSTRVGQWIGETCGRMLKRVSLELGGKNPNVIFADSDLNKAAETAARAAFTNQGQICLCGSRILIELSAAGPFMELLQKHVATLRTGDPSLPETEFGAVTSAQHLAKIEAAVDAAREQGATIHCGGERFAPEGDRCSSGCFYRPTVMTGLDPRCDIEQEEIFGPVVTVTPFASESEAVALANGTPYGLASMVWTNDVSRAHRVAASIDAGIVWVNCWMVRDLRTPFGGAKHSGVGREGGWDALRFFTEPKNVCIRI